MTTINVKKRTSTAWIWWLLGLLALALLLAWAFGVWDRDRVESGVERTVPGAERTVPEAERTVPGGEQTVPGEEAR